MVKRNTTLSRNPRTLLLPPPSPKHAPSPDQDPFLTGEACKWKSCKEMNRWNCLDMNVKKGCEFYEWEHQSPQGRSHREEKEDGMSREFDTQPIQRVREARPLGCWNENLMKWQLMKSRITIGLDVRMNLKRLGTISLMLAHCILPFYLQIQVQFMVCQ